jgi:hypothetical protein
MAYGLMEELFPQAEQGYDERGSVQEQYALFSAPASTLGGVL